MLTRVEGGAGAVRRIAGADDFDVSVLKADRPVLVDFWADWCPPCWRVAPIVEELSGELAGRLTVVSVDVEEHPDLAQRYQTFSLPTLAVFVDGEERIRLIGAHPKRRILAELATVLA